MITIASCWRCGRDWPGEYQGQCPIDGRGVWLQRCVYERGTGRLKAAVHVWVGPCCKLEHSGPETDFYDRDDWDYLPEGREAGLKGLVEKFEPLGEQIVFISPNINSTFGSAQP